MPRHSYRDLESKTKVGWLGTGVMGASMCGHLLAKEHQLSVHTRTKAKAQSLLEKGSSWAETPQALAERCDVIFTMVGFPEDVRQVYFGQAGLLAGIRSGCVFVDMTTTQPSLAKEIHTAAEGMGADAVDAPVSGGDVGARNASLSIMIGGNRATVEALMPFFEAMGKKIVYQGGPGSGQHAKLCNQIVIASTMIGVCESLLYGYKAGLDLNTMLESIRGGAAACWTLDNLAPRMLKRDFDPGFLVDHFIKDMGIALDEGRRLGITLPGLALAHQLYLSVQTHGRGRAGTQALMLALEDLSDTSLNLPS